MAALAGFALALDGVDGHLARRFDQVSDFGARFDMEVDAALILVLCIGLSWVALPVSGSFDRPDALRVSAGAWFFLAVDVISAA